MQQLSEEKKSDLVIFDRKTKEEREYWVNKLAQEIDPSNIGLDYPRPKIYDGETEVVEFELSAELYKKLTDLTGDGAFLLYTTLMAALKICLHKYTGSRTLVVGSPSRKQEQLSAHPANALAIVDQVNPLITFKQFLLNVRQTLLDAYSRQHYPFDRLVRDLGLDELDNKCPLFDVSLALSNIHNCLPAVKNDIAITCTLKPDSIAGKVEFNRNLFKLERIEKFLDHYLNILSVALENTGATISDLQILTPAERQQVLFDWNDTSADYNRAACIQELFEAQVEKTPEAIAVAVEGKEITYRELNLRANKLARHLRALGVGPEVLVAICAERGWEIVLGMIGVLKAGGAFLPLDADYPKERLAYMLSDSQAPVLITLQELRSGLPEHNARTIYLDADWQTIDQQSDANFDCETTPDNLAYMIYTSGSEGKPKGVQVQHGGLVNLVTWHHDVYGVTSSDRASQTATPGFDAYVWEVWPYLTAGASVNIPDRETILSAPKLLRWLAAERITCCFLITALAEVALEAQWPEGLCLKALLTGGDKLHHPPGQALPFLVCNHYGPTEATVVATWAVVAETQVDHTPSIGRPLPNTQIYLLSPDRQPVPVGACGELYIGGDCLARGYLNRADLTADKFVPNPFSRKPGARLYRTGDLARYLSDGNIEFVGRDDHQVKVRGFRIELSEIEFALGEHPAIRETIVLARDDIPGDRRLVAYIVPKAEDQGALSNGELRNYLTEKLPAYMVPAAFVWLDALPLTPNRKVDRRALPAPDWVSKELQATFIAPRNPIEEVLVGVWSHVLNVETVGIHHNFFELGGHSLLATQLISQIREVFRVELPLRALFEAPTVASLGERIELAIKEGSGLLLPAIERASRDEALPLSFAQQRLWFIDQLEPDSAAFNMPLVMRLSGPLNLAALEQSVSEIIRRHESLRTCFPIRDGQPVQFISSPEPISIPVTDLSELPAAERELASKELARTEAGRTFSLATGPLFRVSLLRLAEHEHIVVITMHHIVSDGWSMSILVKELVSLYAAFSCDQPSPLSEISIQYADFTCWQRQSMQGEVLEKHLSYWKQQLGGRLPTLELPTDRPRRAAQSFRGATQTIALSPALSHDLKKLSQEAGTTPFMTMLAAFKSLLYRYSGQEDIVIGTTVANRNHAETEVLIGFFVNMLVLRTDLSGNPTFRELLNRVREVTLGAHAHQDLPFDKLVEALRPDRTASSSPLFQVVFGLHHPHDLALPHLDLVLSPVEIDWHATQFDLIVRAMETEQGLKVLMTYSTDLFEDATITRLLKHYEAWLEAVVLHPESRLLDIPLQLDGEREAWSELAGNLPLTFAAHQFSFGHD